MNEFDEPALFAQLIEMPVAAQQDELQRIESENLALAERMRRLLFAHEQPMLAQAVGFAIPDEHPEIIGPYHVLERLGQGGMGDVYLCQQTEPVRRMVAVKVLKSGMDTREVIARFDAERQALALMTHANIARILDAGTSLGGRPYFVMEYVPGVPLLRYCQKHALSLPDRLNLFVQICAAVQHAHQKGVIHRDIKPTNILVCEFDGKPLPKIIDFGIAKATGAQLTGKTLHTMHGNMIGTPEYMSPEQADIGALDVDTRSDIYALGVVLYELLAGAVPFSFSNQLWSLQSIQRTLRTEEPPLSSRKAVTHARATEHAKDCGYTSAEVLAREIRGDLDRICVKALEKDRSRRYSSAAELAADVNRFLANEPVMAARHGAIYLASRFVRRHAVVSAGCSALVMMLLVFSGYANVQAEALKQERDRANLQTAKTRQVTEFLVNLFAISDPQSGYSREMTIREAVDIGARRVGEELQQQPEVRDALLQVIGRVYNALGLFEDAEETLLSIIHNANADPVLVNLAQIELARSLLERDEFIRAEELLLNVIVDEMADEAVRTEAHVELGNNYMARSRLDEAEQQFRKVLAVTDPVNPVSIVNPHQRALALLGTGDVMAMRSRFSEARDFLERGHALVHETSGENSTAALNARSSLANLYALQGDYEAARPYMEKTLAIARQVYGEDHPATGIAYNDLGFVLVNLKDFAGAEKALLRSLEINRKVFGEQNSESLTAMINLAGVYDRTGRVPEAIPLYEQGLQIREQLYGSESAEVADTLQNLGFAQLRLKNGAAAEISFRRAMTLLMNLHGVDHWLHADAERGLGTALLDQQRYAEAEPHLCAARDVFHRQLGKEHDRTKVAGSMIEQLYAEWSQQRDDMAAEQCQ